MYLSRVEIDVMDRRKIKDLTHLGAYHNWVETSFPDEVDQGTRTRKLWRVDRIRNHLYLLIVSEEKPDLYALEKYGVPGSAETKCYDSFLNSICRDCFYKFRVTLNPVKAVFQADGKRGRVMPEITAEQQLHFLESRAEKLGFELIPEEYQIVERSWEPFRKKGQRMIRLSKATYEGTLKVTDEKLFYDTLTNGIGKKKAYGFGMMTVIPVQQ